MRCSLARLAYLIVCTGLCFAQSRDSGQRQYRALCIGCHGEDGSGGGHGPGFLNVRRPRGTSLATVREVILKGLPDVGMPAFQLSASDADAIAAYVMTLKQPATGAVTATTGVPGDAAAGERFFSGAG